MRGTLAAAIFLSLVTVAAGVESYVWRYESQSELYRTGELDAEHAPTPWLLASSAHNAAARLLYVGPYRPALISDYLDHALKWQPATAPIWLDLAEAQLSEGDFQAASLSLDRAESLWPTRSSLSWRAAGLRIQLGERQKAIEALRVYSNVRPDLVTRAMSMLLRIEPEKGVAVNTLLSGINKKDRNAKYRERLLLLDAYEYSDVEMIRAIWERSNKRLITKPRDIESTFSVYWQHGEARDLLSLWKAVEGEERAFDTLYDSGFESGRFDRWFGWQKRPVEGAQVSRSRVERFSGTGSLLVEFDGSKNVRFAHVRQFVPMLREGVYRLTGYWQGAEIMTKSGVFVDVVSQRDPVQLLAKLEARDGSWDWEKFTLEFEAKGPPEFIEIRIRRNASTAFDNKIQGNVWFDDLVLERLDNTVSIHHAR